MAVRGRCGALVELKVECYAGYRGEETPRRLDLDGRTVEVLEVIDRWYGPDHRYVKVRGDDRAAYLIRSRPSISVLTTWSGRALRCAPAMNSATDAASRAAGARRRERGTRTVSLCPKSAPPKRAVRPYPRRRARPRGGPALHTSRPAKESRSRVSTVARASGPRPGDSLSSIPGKYRRYA